MAYDQGTMLAIALKLDPNCILLDQEDYERFKFNKVYIDNKGYVRIYLLGKVALLHQAVTNFQHERLDHKNNITKDCRKENLRPATRSQNGQNQPAFINNTSGFKGVNFHKGSKKWHARIRANGTRYHLGDFNSAEEAHEAYKKAAVKYFGEFACA